MTWGNNFSKSGLWLQAATVLHPATNATPSCSMCVVGVRNQLGLELNTLPSITIAKDVSCFLVRALANGTASKQITPICLCKYSEYQ